MKNSGKSQTSNGVPKKTIWILAIFWFTIFATIFLMINFIHPGIEKLSTIPLVEFKLNTLFFALYPIAAYFLFSLNLYILVKLKKISLKKYKERGLIYWMIIGFIASIIGAIVLGATVFTGIGFLSAFISGFFVGMIGGLLVSAFLFGGIGMYAEFQ